jgi:hypothetical protein
VAQLVQTGKLMVQIVDFFDLDSAGQLRCRGLHRWLEAVVFHA